MMDESNEDKRIEHARYNERAKNLNPSIFHETETRGAKAVPLYFRSPYTYYEEQIRCHINAQSLVLEIGSGIGMHTGALLEFGGHVMATDISEYSLEVLQTRYSGYERLLTKVADMESLPFQDESFDVVTSAGSLSYGDNDIVLSEIYRVLKRGGILIAVDSLNNSPVYRFNRWLHYLRGNRSKSTLARMPNIGLIQKYRTTFGDIDVKYFGSISWLIPLISNILSQSACANLSDSIDSLIKVKRSAFKFVMVATKTR